MPARLPDRCLDGFRVGITAGPTRAWLDPVRYLANASTGALGLLIADKFLSLGAEVFLLLGPSPLACIKDGSMRLHVGPQAAREFKALGKAGYDNRLHAHPVESPQDLLDALYALSIETQPAPIHRWIHSMAVLDYLPEQVSPEKIDSSLDSLTLRLKPSPKVIRHIKPFFPGCELVGFKLLTSSEPEGLRLAANKLAQQAGCDLVVANPSPFPTEGNPSPTHLAYFLETDTNNWTGPVEGKHAIAEEIVKWRTQAWCGA